jgi:hypothetical protein
MGYSCPVCDSPQHDSEHLANHLAMTAMLHEDDHEAWLDEHVDGWGELTPPELGKRVVDGAEQVDYDEAAAEEADIPEEFQDEATADDHEHDIPDSATVTRDGPAGAGTDSLDAETEAVLEEAREMTRERLEQADEDDDAESR